MEVYWGEEGAHGEPAMIENFSFGSITISGKQYTSDLKIINGQVYPDWLRKTGHSVDNSDVADFLKAKTDSLIIGTGVFGSMKLNVQLKQHLTDHGIQVIEEPTIIAIGLFNLMYADDKNVAAGFHLTC